MTTAAAVPVLTPAKTEKRYICVGKDGRGHIEKVRKFMESNGRRTFSEFHMSGGLDGDLGKEIAEVTDYRLHTGGSVQTYTVLDDSCNGYAELISVFLTGDAERLKEAIDFLDSLDFVHKHRCLKERPMGYKSFAPYLNDLYYPSQKKPFIRE